MANNLEQILAKLEGVKQCNGGYVARCPAHEDRMPSLSIKESEDKVLVFCHAGCSYEAVMKALGISKPVPVGEKVDVAHYNYTDEYGKLILQVVRSEPKDFSQRKPTEDGWEWNTKDVKAPLYNLPAVIEAIKGGKYVLFVEGEKDVETLRFFDITASSIRGGASGKWNERYTRALEGAKVAIIPDNDAPGHKHALRVAECLYGWASSVKLIELPGQGAGDDTTDWLFREGNSRLKLANLLNNAPEYLPPQIITRDEFNVLKYMVKAQAKEIKSLRWKLFEQRSKKRKDGE